jgi:hypothetical protein
VVPALPAPSASSSQFALAFRRVLPPGLLRTAFHIPNSGNKSVEQARIVPLSGDTAQVIVHRIRITSRQLGRQRYTQPAQITGDGCADVGNVLQTSNVSLACSVLC